MEKLWLKNYPAGVPADIDADRYASLVDVFEQSCRRFADRPAFRNLGRTLTFAQLEQLTTSFAAYLQHLGLARGERVALMLPNVLQYPVALFGTLRAGLTAVNTNPMYTPRELEHQLKDSGAKCIVILANFAHVLEQVIGEDGGRARHRDRTRRSARLSEGAARELRRSVRAQDGSALSVTAIAASQPDPERGRALALHAGGRARR